MAISKETISDIKNRVNIVDIISDNIALTRTGRQFLGLCPFHNEKTPSFNVLEDKQFYHCFGCGKSGDVFKFIEDYRQVSFLDSVAIVAEYAGVTIETSEAQIRKSSRKHPHHDLLSIHQDAASFYHAILMTTKEGELARNYLKTRGLTDDLLIYFNVGLSPNQNDFLYRSVSKKYSEKVLFDSGLFHVARESNRFYDAFTNRIMFPLTNDNGQTIAFSGRIWQEEQLNQSNEAKYKNSTATPIFNKSYELYHLDKVKTLISKSKEVYIMEGFMDVIAAYKSGVKNVVASMGTALTKEHVKHLQRYAKKVVLAYDGDEAGQNAIAKSLDLLAPFDVSIVKFPEKLDPDEFLQKNSSEALAKLLLESKMSAIEFLIYYLWNGTNSSLQSEIDYVEKISKIIIQSPSITAQNTYVHLVADLLPHFDYEQVEQAVNNERLLQRKILSKTSKAEEPFEPIKLQYSKSLTAIQRAEKQFLYHLIQNTFIRTTFQMREPIIFDTDGYQLIFNILMEKGEISSLDLHQLDEQVQSLYYDILEENLPDDTDVEELERILIRRDHLIADRELKQSAKRIRESVKGGDEEEALLFLQNLITKKRNNE